MKKQILYCLTAVCLSFGFFSSCVEDATVTVKEKDSTDDKNPVLNDSVFPDDDVNANYPSYKDDYRNDTAWDKRKSWNLANVHDPSVDKWTDGYYYMYQTDASFGNSHSGKGHFYGRRSQDLVNWESVGMALPEAGAKSWILAKVNEYRRQMNVPVFNSINDISWGYWAPTVKTVTKSDGTTVMRMYYDVVIDNYIYSGKRNVQANFDNSWTERAFIGLAESTNPASPLSWVDKGFVLCSSSAKGTNFPSSTSSSAPSNAAYYRPSTNDWNGYFYFNAIDPTYIPGNHDESYTATDYMIYGSWHHGFAGVEIDRDSGLVKGHFTKNDDGTYTNTIGLPWADSPEGLAANGYGTKIYCRGKSDGGWQPSEGPEVMYNSKDKKYYMFFANDGLDVPYHTRVIRSSNPISGYKDIYGRGAINGGSGTGSCYPIVTHPYKFKGDHGWVGISHCGIIEKDGEWFYTSQARFPADYDNWASNAIMMGHVRKILWCPNGTDKTDLWPIASPERYGNIPTKNKAIAEEDIIGKWEHINLIYDYGKMDESEYVEFKNDHTISGAFNGKWALKSSEKYLEITLGMNKPADISDSIIILKLDRELDWEKAPRSSTLVYAGISSAKNNVSPVTFWGKKVSN